MKPLFAVLIALGVLMVVAFPVSADFDKDDIAELVEMVEKGEGFDEHEDLPIEQMQKIRFSIYVVDIKAQLCFTGGLSLVPCEALKKAFPLIAPLITWVK